MPLILGSKTQKMVCLSSSEAELVALTLCAQESKFAQMLLEEIDDNTQRPFIINEDNTGAIFLAENQSVGGRTKHIDTKVSFIRDLIEDNYCHLLYIKSENNYADIGSKNQSVKLFTAMEEAINEGMLLQDQSQYQSMMAIAITRGGTPIMDPTDTWITLDQDHVFEQQKVREMPTITCGRNYGHPHVYRTAYKNEEGLHWDCFSFVNGTTHTDDKGCVYGIEEMGYIASYKEFVLTVKGPPCASNRKTGRPDTRNYMWDEAVLLFPEAVAAHIILFYSDWHNRVGKIQEHVAQYSRYDLHSYMNAE